MTLTPPPTDRFRILLPAATVALVAWLAAPSLAEAATTDLYNRGLPLALAIWLAPQVFYALKLRSPAKPHSHFWIGLALLLCVLGSMSDFRVLYHLSLAAAVPGFCGLRVSGLIAFMGAASWLPATGWLISRFKTSGLIGWERPLAATLISLLLLVVTLRLANRNSTHHSNP